MEWSNRAPVTGRSLLFAWLPTIACMAGIFVLSAQSNLQFAGDPGSEFVIRKIGHMFVFGVLATSIFYGLARTSSARGSMLTAFALTLLAAAGDELHQGLVVGRDPWIVDVAIDGAGAALALGAVRIVWQRRVSVGID